MSTHKCIDKICYIVLAAALVSTALFMNGVHLGIKAAETVMGYESRLFDNSKVHSIQIIMDDWEKFIDTCTSEEYSACTVVIDNEAYKNVAIRAKGNTSLTQVEAYGNDRYSFKIEFDHYDSTESYYGLDKLCLNNIIQDHTYMKDYLTYQMMDAFGVAAPLCSYVDITVNGEAWGLYLAVEGIEESFLQRNYGPDYGELYKPDSQSMGGGRGNGKEFDMNADFSDANPDAVQDNQAKGRAMHENGNGKPPFEMTPPDSGTMREGGMNPNGAEGMAGNFQPGAVPNGMFGGQGSKGSNDVALIYTDDDYESYSNIFENAKTDITVSDKDRLIASLKSLNANEMIEEVVDVDAVIRYFVVHNFVLNFDSYTGSMIHNYYLYEKDGQMSMLPWDYNLAFGGFQSATDATSLVNYPIDTPVSGGTTDSRPMLAWIFENEEYTALYHQYFSEFISEYFDSGYFSEMMDTVREMILLYVVKDPTKFCTYEEFECGIATLKEFCLLRAESITGQLKGTIASTSEAQAISQENMVDASDLTVSDMGSMNNGMQGNPPDVGMVPQGTAPNGQPPEIPANENTNEAGTGTTEVAGRPDVPQRDKMDTETASQTPDGESAFDPNSRSSNDKEAWAQVSGESGMSNMGDKEGPPDMQSELPENERPALILLGISIGVLLLGVCFALLYKKRK